MLHDSEVAQRMREALEAPDAEFPVEGHPMMRPFEGFVDLVRNYSTFFPFLIPLYFPDNILGIIDRRDTPVAFVPHARRCRRTWP